MKKTSIVSISIFAVLIVAIAGLTLLSNAMEYMPARHSLPSKEKCVEKYGEDAWASYEFWQGVGDWDFLKDKSDSKEVAQQYILLRNQAFVGTRCFEVKIYTDKTGTMSCRFVKEQDYKVSFSDTISLNEKQTKEIIKIINENGFWAQELDTRMGLDGNITIIEGISGNRYNYLDLWCAEPESAEYKIYYGIYDCYYDWR